jgi:flagellar FliJ protein
VAEKKSKRLEVVLNLAQLKEDAAARQLGEALNALEQGKQQLEMLNDYRNDNQEHIRQVGKGHATGSQLHRHQMFLQQIETAISQQGDRMTMLTQRVEVVKKNWQQLHYRRKAIGDHVQKIQRDEDRVQEKKNQMEMDDRPFNPRTPD